MPETPHVIEAVIANVKTTKKDGTLLMTQKGVPFIVVGIKDEVGGWLNLTAFDTAFHPLLFQGAQVKIAYIETMRTNGFGEPELYNGMPQWNRNITAVKSLDGAGATQTAQNGAPTVQATQGSPAPHFEQDRNESIREQTALKCAAEMYAAVLSASKKPWDFEEFERVFTGTKAVLDGKNELDLVMDAAKEKMEAEPIIDMPGPNAPENPEDHEFDGVL